MERKENSTYPENRKPYRGPKNHAPRGTSAPTLHPTTKDIAWAAGIIEGEGSVCKAKKCHFGQGIKLTVVQKDDWILRKLRDLFGGSLAYQNAAHDAYKKGPTRLPIWRISGVRAFGLTMTIFQFMSPRRQEQFRSVWGKRMEAA